jgi:hypothetical protein
VPPGFIWDQLGIQIYHHQPILGGYAGRISRSLLNRYKSNSFFGQLLNLEEENLEKEKTVTQARFFSTTEACNSLNAFKVSYVLLYPAALNARTFNFVRQFLPMQLIDREKDVELYGTACR